MGLVPLYITDREQWLPYAGPGGAKGSLWESMALVMKIEEYPAFLRESNGLAAFASDEAGWAARKAVIRAHRDSHFTYRGVLDHVFRLILDPLAGGSDLQCVYREI
jgi:hypothetical protein